MTSGYSAFGAGDQEAIFRAVAQFNSLISQANQSAAALKGIGTAGANVGPQIAGGLGSAESKIDTFTGKLDKAADKLNSTGKSLTTKVTLPAVAIGGAMIKTYADFDLAITKAGAKTGATAKQMDQMRAEAQQMGAQTIFSATDAANALDNLAALGLNARDSMAALPAVMKGAQGSGTDLATMATVVAQSMDAWSLKAKDAGHISDVLATAANNSAADVNGLAEAFQQAGQLGSSANQSIEEVTAAVEVLANKGLPPAMGGTALRQAIQFLAAPHSSKAVNTIKTLGLNVYDATGKLKPLHEILDEINRVLDPTSKGMQQFMKDNKLAAGPARALALNNVFGVQGMTAINLLLARGRPFIINRQKDTARWAQLQAGLNKELGEKGAAAFIKAHTEGNKFVATGHDVQTALTAMNLASSGTSDKMAKMFGATTAQKIDNMIGSLQNLAITLVQTVAPTLNSLVDGLQKAVNWFAQFAKDHPLVAKFIIGAAAMAAALGPVLIVLSKIIKAVSTITKAGAAVGRAFGFGRPAAPGTAAAGAAAAAEPTEVYALRTLPVEVMNAATLASANREAQAGQTATQQAAGAAEPQEVVAASPLPVDVVNAAAIGAASGEAAAAGAAGGSAAEQVTQQVEQQATGHAAPQEVVAASPLPVDVVNAAAIGTAAGAASSEGSTVEHGLGQRVYAIEPLPVYVENIAALGVAAAGRGGVPVVAGGAAGAAGAGGAGALSEGEAAIAGAAGAGALARRPGLLARIGAGARGVFGRVGAVAPWATLAYFGASAIPGASQPGSAGNIAAAAVKGGAVGATVGSAVPVVGTGLGAVIGATVTATWAFLRSREGTGPGGQPVIQGLDTRGQQRQATSLYTKSIAESGRAHGSYVDQVTNAKLATTDLVQVSAQAGISQDQLTGALTGTNDEYQRLIDLLTASGQLTDQRLLKLGQIRTEYENGVKAARHYADATGAAMRGDLEEVRGAKLLRDAVGGSRTAHESATRAYVRFGTSLQNISDSIAANGRSLDTNTASGRENYRVLRDAAAAALADAQAVTRRTGSLQAGHQTLVDDRKAILDTAEAMGLNRRQAEKMIDQIYRIPKNAKTDVVFNHRAASLGIRDVRNALAGIPRNVRIGVDVEITRGGNLYTPEGVRRALGPGYSAPHARGGEIPGLAGGGELRGPGGPTSDLLWWPGTRVSNKEFVVNAEQYRRNRAAVQQINAGRPDLAMASLANSLDKHRVELPRALSLTNRQAQAPRQTTVVFSPTIHNPAPETAADSITRTYQKLTYMGLDAWDVGR